MLTELIFKLSAPWNNPYQNEDPRLLFVCSAGLLRSPTGAELFSKKGYNTRSCGSHIEFALIPLTANLIRWANLIVFVHPENEARAVVFFKDEWREELIRKSIILDIPDKFTRNDPDLVHAFDLFSDAILTRIRELAQG